MAVALTGCGNSIAQSESKRYCNIFNHMVAKVSLGCHGEIQASITPKCYEHVIEGCITGIDCSGICRRLQAEPYHNGCLQCFSGNLDHTRAPGSVVTSIAPVYSAMPRTTPAAPS